MRSTGPDPETSAATRVGWWLMAFAAAGMLLLIVAGRLDQGDNLDGMASVVAPAALPELARPGPQARPQPVERRTSDGPQSQRRPRVRVILPEPVDGESDVPRL